MSWPTVDENFPQPPNQNDGSRRWSPLVKLAMRMGWASKDNANIALTWDNVMPPFEFVSAYECKTAGKVYIFGVVRGTPMMFDDDIYMFPSDRLIGQLRTLQN